MKGGYIMIDCGGLNLLSESSQTIAGLYSKVSKAISRNKPVYLYNCKYGAGVSTSPIQAFGYVNSGSYVLTTSIYQITVASTDAVTISDLLPEDTNT